MVVPIGEDEQVMTLITRTGEKEFQREEFGSFRFVPMLGNKN